MAALLTYEISLDWVPDPTYINSIQGIHYLAWQIGRDEKRAKGIWLIEPVIPSPVSLETLLPFDYISYEFLSDTLSYGHVRSAQTEKSVDNLQASFLAEVAIVEQQVIDGFR